MKKCFVCRVLASDTAIKCVNCGRGFARSSDLCIEDAEMIIEALSKIQAVAEKWYTVVASVIAPIHEPGNTQHRVEVVLHLTAIGPEEAVAAVGRNNPVIAAFAGRLPLVRGWDVEEYERQRQFSDDYRRHEREVYDDLSNFGPGKKVVKHKK